MTQLSIYEQMVEIGTPIDHHESDLYVVVNEDTKKIVDGYRFESNVTMFKCKRTGNLFFDIPFAYTPFWEREVGKVREG